MSGKNNKLKKMVMASIFAALTFVATGILPHIPIPGTGGYVHIGDAVIVAASLLFGPLVGAISGAVGSSMADLVAAPMYVVPTFLIKGIMGLIIGAYCQRMQKITAKQIVAFILAAVVMVGGYYVTEAVIFGSLLISVSISLFNLAQYIVGIVLGYVIYLGLRGRME